LPPQVEPLAKRWTREEYFRLSDLGAFQDKRVQRIDWEIVEMPGQNNPHAWAVTRSFRAIDRVFGQTHSVRISATLGLGPPHDPDPDVAVVDWDVERRSNPPDTAVLVVEVGDSTLRYNLGRKANLYAAGGILDYWVLDIPHRQLHVHRNPVADPDAPFGFHYPPPLVIPADGVATPLAAPNASIRVADMLP
jgi:Uma2 family endonuclease